MARGGVLDNVFNIPRFVFFLIASLAARPIAYVVHVAKAPLTVESQPVMILTFTTAAITTAIYWATTLLLGIS